MVDPLPTAAFGKPDGASAYQVISKHPVFDEPELARAFKKICTSFEWNPSPNGGTHEPCYAIVPLGPTILIARYSDAGRDFTGRPHTLRIDCILTDKHNFQQTWKGLAGSDEAIPSNPKLIGDPTSFSST